MIKNGIYSFIFFFNYKSHQIKEKKTFKGFFFLKLTLLDQLFKYFMSMILWKITNCHCSFKSPSATCSSTSVLNSS